MSPTPARPPRKAKTPRQRAEEALAVAERAVTRTEAAYVKAHRLANALALDKAAAIERRDFLRQDPALKRDTATTVRSDELNTDTPGGDA